MKQNTCVSLIIVSHQRPTDLALCLQSLKYQTHNDFEVIVVADALPGGFSDKVKYIQFNDQNISKARNLGINRAAGDIIAFCDDDAIPDPAWLERLITPFTINHIGSTGGFTRGRNGVSRQWGAMRFTQSGDDIPIEIDENKPYVEFSPIPEQPHKLIGTNMAFRTKALHQVGGFDEAYLFFLEDADIKLRLDQAGWSSAAVPLAQVHHNFSASTRRNAKRVPLDLYEIGASKAYFCNKFAPNNITTAINDFVAEQEKRLSKLVSSGQITSEEVSNLLNGLKNGFKAGVDRKPNTQNLKQSDSTFLRFDTGYDPHILLCGFSGDLEWAMETAEAIHSMNCCVTTLILDSGIRRLRLRFTGKTWAYEGGIGGKSELYYPIVGFINKHTRLKSEANNIARLLSAEYIVYNRSGEFSDNDLKLKEIYKKHVEKITR